MIDREDYKYLKNILSLHNPDINLEYLDAVLVALRSNPDRTDDILDSFSNNQIKAKNTLVNLIRNLGILDKDCNVTIWGSWYASILVPLLHNYVNSITCVDIDTEVSRVAKNYLFNNLDNITYASNDVFEYKKDYINTNLFINTSCEHMAPMKEWKWFGAGAMSEDSTTEIFRTPKIPDKCYFAFQSNNMFDIEGHINCVSSMQEFEIQLPDRAKVLHREEIADTRGTRYMLIGQFIPL